MFTYPFRTEQIETLRAFFAPRKPRHPLLRLVFGVIGVALLAVLVVIGLFIGVAMLLAGAVLRLLRPRNSRAASVESGSVVQGEYRVIDKSALPGAH